jgi:hypothetical protein
MGHFIMNIFLRTIFVLCVPHGHGQHMETPMKKFEGEKIDEFTRLVGDKAKFKLVANMDVVKAHKHKIETEEKCDSIQYGFCYR